MFCLFAASRSATVDNQFVVTTHAHPHAALSACLSVCIYRLAGAATAVE